MSPKRSPRVEALGEDGLAVLFPLAPPASQVRSVVVPKVTYRLIFGAALGIVLAAVLTPRFWKAVSTRTALRHVFREQSACFQRHARLFLRATLRRNRVH